MSVLMQIGGLVWVFFGIGNIFATPWRVMSNAGALEGLVFNGLVFLLPGLMVYSWGEARATLNTESCRRRPSYDDETTH